ncbi:hypothetical protein EO244_05970 [Ancylomarina salipaludis]|uniref:Lipoprotein n=1 Tax=Ancylomarina salipaludis TaxID=2501299 RepID=A0A4V1N0A0_9BACT|nr:hypothetical protein [Ancylomarina salipaludis]RXQ95853.1 hypothetical protein EO244_05970 [Ancylomarina salipaludis]
MKRVLKIKWLISFAVISSVFLSLSCETITEREFDIEFVYRNNSKSQLELVLMGIIQESETLSTSEGSLKSILISPNDEIVIKGTFPTNNKNVERPIGILKQNNLLGDSIKIIFNSELLLIFKKDEAGKDGLYLESNYQYEKLDDLSFRYSYFFTDEDYTNVTILEEN